MSIVRGSSLFKARPRCTASLSRCSASSPADLAPRKPLPHCSGASMQVPSIHRRKGLADSTRLRSRRPSCLEASAVDGETVTSDASRASDTCGGERGEEVATVVGHQAMWQAASCQPAKAVSSITKALLPQPLPGRAAAC